MTEPLKPQLYCTRRLSGAADSFIGPVFQRGNNPAQSLEERPQFIRIG
jgi:hypothetical protein